METQVFRPCEFTNLGEEFGVCPQFFQFVVNQFQLQKNPYAERRRKMRARWTYAARSAQELITAFDLRGLSLTADLLREAVALN